MFCLHCVGSTHAQGAACDSLHSCTPTTSQHTSARLDTCLFHRFWVSAGRGVWGAAMTSSHRQRQLQLDRQRTKAISIYLNENRDKFLHMLVEAEVQDKSLKRKALEREARRAFKAMSESEQSAFMTRAVKAEVCVRASGGQGVVGSHDAVRASGSQDDAARASGSQGSHDAASAHVGDKGHKSPVIVKAKEEKNKPSPAIEKRKRPRSTASPAKSLKSAGSPAMAPAGLPLESQWSATGRPLRDGLLRAVPHLCRLCGDAGAAEVFARGLRVLDVMESSVAAWPLSASVKVAIVAGVSLKLTQTQAEGLVQTLWTKVAGKSAIAQIREWEPKLLNGWASNCIGSEYALQSECASQP